MFDWLKRFESVAFSAWLKLWMRLICILTGNLVCSSCRKSGSSCQKASTSAVRSNPFKVAIDHKNLCVVKSRSRHFIFHTLAGTSNKDIRSYGGTSSSRHIHLLLVSQKLNWMINQASLQPADGTGSRNIDCAFQRSTGRESLQIVTFFML